MVGIMHAIRFNSQKRSNLVLAHIAEQRAFKKRIGKQLVRHPQQCDFEPGSFSSLMHSGLSRRLPRWVAGVYGVKIVFVVAIVVVIVIAFVIAIFVVVI